MSDKNDFFVFEAFYSESCCSFYVRPLTDKLNFRWFYGLKHSLEIMQVLEKEIVDKRIILIIRVSDLPSLVFLKDGEFWQQLAD
jgi:hypothetical protein